MYPMGLSSVLDVRRSEENIPPTYTKSSVLASKQYIIIFSQVSILTWINEVKLWKFTSSF